jgi:hypothetical protein
MSPKDSCVEGLGPQNNVKGGALGKWVDLEDSDLIRELGHLDS